MSLPAIQRWRWLKLVSTGAILSHAVACIPKPTPSNINIVGGQPATPHAHPFMVSIYSERNQQTICGGSLIAPKVVLTAAHCFSDAWFPGWQHKVRIGKHNILKKEAREESLSIAKVRIHPDFVATDRGMRHDIALVFLQSASQFPPIRLNRDPAQPSIGSLLKVVGWGLTNEESFFIPQYELVEVDLPVVDRPTCTKLNRQFDILDQHLCAGVIDGKTQKDACQGDSGGPLFSSGTTPILYGVVSMGNGCGRIDTPGMYTRVSAYADWI